MTQQRTASEGRRRIIPVILLAVLLISGSVFLVNRKDSDIIIVTFPSGTQIESEVADTPEKLFFGLAFRDGLPPDTGMLYIFDVAGLHRLHTKGYRIPIDMVWVDESRHVVHLFENAVPCPGDPCPFYGPPPEPARYIIQTPSGFIRKEGLRSGMELKFTLRL